MESAQTEAKKAVRAPMYWQLDYVLAGVVFVVRASLVWKHLQSHPAEALALFYGGLATLYSLLPVIVGRSFRRLLKKRLETDSLSIQTFSVCDWRIAQLLYVAYLGMLLFSVQRF
ncbi:MAG TPA: hypothetical protein VMT38_07420 [Terracidiphilus sp.]|nr:hypothetical protein [Terracidiphilus sp.]